MSEITLVQPYIIICEHFKCIYKTEHLSLFEGYISSPLDIKLVPLCNNIWIIKGQSVREFINLKECVTINLTAGNYTIVISEHTTSSITDNSYILKEFLSIPKTSDSCQIYLNMFFPAHAINSNAHMIRMMIIDEAGDITIDDISAATGYCNRHINRIFTAAYGYGPKDFAKATRIAGVLLEIIKQPNRSNLEFITNSGYSDQAHFQREFKHFLGETPREFIKRLQ